MTDDMDTPMTDDDRADTGMPTELADAITRAAEYLTHLREQNPDLPAGVLVMVLLTEAADARDYGETHYSHALTGLATRIALDYRHHTISAQVN